MELALIWLVVLSGCGLCRLAEMHIHSSHYAVLIGAGGVDRAPGLMRAYYAFFLLLPPVALAEQIVFVWPLPRELVVTGLVLIACAVALRYWAIHSLGVFWTMRCVQLPGARETKRGPYRWIYHPEYLSRVIEVVGLGLIFGARYATALFAMLALVFTIRVVSVERDQLASQPAFK